MIYTDDTTTRQWLEKRAGETPDDVFGIYEDRDITYAAMDREVNRLANGFLKLGFQRNDRIALMLPNHPDFVYIVLAFAKIGLTYIPLNTGLKGANLDTLLQLSKPRAVIADASFRDVICDSLNRAVPDGLETLFVHGNAEPFDVPLPRRLLFSEIGSRMPETPPEVPGTGPDDVLALSFTSGTTGLPKGVPLTDRMLRTCALSASQISDAKPGEVMLMWESFCHIGGVQMIYVCMIYGAKLALLSRFSASRFWDEARHYKATRIHYLGSVLQILLKQPPRPDDREHNVEYAWGAGSTPEIWTAFEERFGVKIRETYGMTECSSITTINTYGKIGSIGKAVSHFEVRVVDENGNPVPPNVLGELQVRGRQPGLTLKEYFQNPEATKKALLPDGWFCSGDQVYMDEEGFYYFKGRSKDSVRHNGENVSAWEVEHIINEHPDIEECALIGVPGDIDDDLKLFIKRAPGHTGPEPEELIRWCEARMAKYQVPRYLAFIDQFEKTPSQRTTKANLSNSTDDCWDRFAK